MRRLIRRAFLPTGRPGRLGCVADVLDGLAGLVQRRLALLTGTSPACAARPLAGPPPGAPDGRWGAGGIFSALRTRRIVDALTRWPTLSSSPWILLYPQPLFSVASRSMSALSRIAWMR